MWGKNLKTLSSKLLRIHIKHVKVLFPQVSKFPPSYINDEHIICNKFSPTITGTQPFLPEHFYPEVFPSENACYFVTVQFDIANVII